MRRSCQLWPKPTSRSTFQPLICNNQLQLRHGHRIYFFAMTLTLLFQLLAPVVIRQLSFEVLLSCHLLFELVVHLDNLLEALHFAPHHPKIHHCIHHLTCLRNHKMCNKLLAVSQRLDFGFIF